MSNNIYDIMNKLNAVANKDIPATKIEGTGKTLLESTMKEVLNEKYMGFDKTVAAIKKGGSAKNPEAVAASIGRKKYGKEKFQAAAAQGKKLSERTWTNPETGEYHGPYSDNLQTTSVPGLTKNDLIQQMQRNKIDRMQPPANQSTSVPGLTQNDLIQQMQRNKIDRMLPPANQSTTIKGMQEDDADIPMPGNKLSPKDQYQAIKKDVEKVQSGARYPIGAMNNLRKDSDVGRFAAPGYGDQGQFFQEDDMEEGNLFTGNLAKARAQGKKRADLDGDGDMETVREGAKPDYIDLDKDGNRKESMKKAAKDKKKQGVAEGTKETSTGRVHKAEPGGYGRRDDDEDGDKKKTEPAVKRGRGRPKKDADSDTGEVKQYDTDTLQRWIVGSVPKKLPGKASVKHKIKDEPDEKLDEKAPPGAKAERMVKHIKQGYAKDGKLTDKEKGIAYATAWKAKKAGKVEESIPPGFPRSLAKKIYEHYAGDMNQTLNAMWRVHSAIMESKSTPSTRKKVNEGRVQGGIWRDLPPKPGEKDVPAPQDVDGGSAPAPKPQKPVAPQKPAAPQKKAEVDTDTDLAEMLNLAGIKSQVDEAELAECGMSSSPISGGYGNSMHDTEGSMNISTNMSTDGNKSVTITADGDAAAELMQMLKIAGLNSDGMSNVKDGADLDHPGAVEIHGTMDSEGAEELAKKLSAAELDEAKDPRYHANTTPEEEVLPVQTQLKGGDGDVAGKEKKMRPHGYKFSDNPLSMKESMSLKLMKEYEGIKKTV